MTSTYEDRTLLATDVAIKAPCRAATTANIVLNGLQTVDGVVLAAGDRVLVKNQTSGVNNGIYLASTGDWTRASDFQGNRAAVTGTFVSITSGTVNSGTFYQCTTANPIIVGSSNLTFAQGSLGPISIPVAVAQGGTGAATAATARTNLGSGTAGDAVFTTATTLAGRQALLLDAHGADIASAATVNLDTATGDLVDITGVVTITAITLAEGVKKTVRFTGALTLTNGASLVLPGGVNIVTAAGDFAIFCGYAAGVVRCVSYSPLKTFAGPLDISNAAAGQIKFPSIQNASANANTLDDYAEGTWTPGMSFAGASVGITYTAQLGKYTKIGRLVIASFNVILSSKGSSVGAARITGLPFAASANAAQGVSALLWSALTTAVVTLVSATDQSATTAQLWRTTAAATGVSNLTDVDVSNTTEIDGTFVYSV